jgi:predicted secreted protein
MRFLLSFAALLLTACTATKSVVSDQAIIRTAQDHDKTLSIATGQRFEIHLDENPSTGYAWEVAGQPELLVLQNSDYVSNAQLDQQGKVPVGGGGQRSFVFVAQKSGTTTLKLKHWRSWLGDKSIVDTFSIPIQIK